MIKQYISVINILRDTLKKPLVYIIIAQLAIGIFSWSVGFIVWKNKNKRIEYLEGQIANRDSIIIDKSQFILTVLWDLNTRTTMFLDSANAEIKRLKK